MCVAVALVCVCEQLSGRVQVLAVLVNSVISLSVRGCAKAHTLNINSNFVFSCSMYSCKKRRKKMMNISRKDLAVAIHLPYGLLALVNQSCCKTLCGIYFFMVEAEGCGFPPYIV